MLGSNCHSIAKGFCILANSIDELSRFERENSYIQYLLSSSSQRLSTNIQSVSFFVTFVLFVVN
jgi:hypothetical protein